MDKNLENLPVNPQDKVPLKEKLIYGAADIFGGGQATMLSLLLLVFFTDVIKLDAALAATVILVSKLWDAISDPLCGIASDNIRTKWGRRRPFMLVGGLLIIPALAFLFAPIQNVNPEGLRMTIAAIAYVCYCTVSTVSQVPYMSMSSDLSPDYRERNSANTIKLVFDMGSAAVCYLLPATLLESLKAGTISQTAFYLSIVLGFGILFSAPMVLAAFKIKERCPYPAERSRFDFKGWLKSFNIKSFRYHIIMYVGAFLCMDIISALAIYYTANVLRGVTLFGMKMGSVFLIAPMMVMAGIAIPFCYYVMRKKTKQFAFRMGLPAYILGAAVLGFYQTSWNPIIVPIAAIVMGIGLGGAQMMPWIIFPDTIDVAELKLGYRPTGNFSGIMTFSRKLSTAVAIQLVGVVLSASGYVSSSADESVIQPDSVLLAIRILMGVSVLLLISLAFYASMRYKVTNKKLDRIRYFNDAAKENKVLSDEEAAEKQKLIKELC